MTEKQSFAPSWKWHAKVLFVILLLCTLAFFCFSCVTKHLPPVYQKRVPPAETTPWLK